MIFQSQNHENKIIIIGNGKNLDQEEQLNNEIRHFNEKILNFIMDDNDEEFLTLLTKADKNIWNLDKTFQMNNFKLHQIINSNPTYVSLCAFFGAEKCFTAILSLFPMGINSREVQKLDDFKRSPVHFACFGGNLNILKQLHSAGFSLNALNENEYLPSHYAAMAGRLECIQFLWSQNADIFTTSSFKTTITPVQTACYYGNLDIVKFFFEVVSSNNNESIIKRLVDGDLFKFDREKNDLVLLNKQQTPLHYACIGGHVNIVNYFISKSNLIELQINKPGKGSRSPLSCACNSGSIECVKALMNCRQLKLNKHSKKDNTYLPLVDAAAGGYLDIVKYLLQDKRIDINQETSLNISAIQAAVKNNHFDIVKCLYENGATKSLNNNKIGNIFLDACETKNIQLMIYLDKIMQIPYHDIFIDDKKKIIKKMVLLNDNCSEQITYGDVYMHQACSFEDQEMVNFLLSKECSFNLFNVQKIVKKKTKSFIDFLTQKGLEISHSNDESKNDELIVSIIKSGNLSKLKSMISKGFILNKEIITKYNCIQLCCSKVNLKMFQFLMSYQPKLTEECIISSMREAMYKYMYTVILDKDPKKLNDILILFDQLLSIHIIDLNLPIYQCDENTSFVSFAISHNDLNLLHLFEKYNANFKDCKPNFEHLLEKEFISTLNFLKEHGYNFQNMEQITHCAYPVDSTISFPLGRMVSQFCFSNRTDPTTILYIMDFSTPEQILKTRTNNMNLVDVFVNCNCPDGIIKAYKLTNSVFYPLMKSKEEYLEWVKETNHPELINILISQLSP